MAELNGFAIENGVLERYTGPGGDVVIPDGVTRIGTWAFRNCRTLLSVVIPEGVTEIEAKAFQYCYALESVTFPESLRVIGDTAFECCKLSRVTIPKSTTEIGAAAFAYCPLREFVVRDPDFVLSPTLFGAYFPEPMRPYVWQWYPRMSQTAVKTYILEYHPRRGCIWDDLTPVQQRELFMAHQGRPLMRHYKKCIKDPKAMAREILRSLPETLSAKECNAVANFMEITGFDLPDEELHTLYNLLLQQKAAQKALSSLATLPSLMERLTAQPQTDLQPEEKVVHQALDHLKITVRELKNFTKDIFGLTDTDLPPVRRKDGTAVAPYVLLWLLIAHGHFSTPYCKVRTTQKPGILPEAQAVLEELEKDDFQAMLATLSQRLGGAAHLKNNRLSYPICRYAEEKLMRELTQKASSWRSKTYGDNTLPFSLFRDGCLYSDTRAAMLFADRYHFLGDYADLRNMSEDALRDKYISDVGLDARGEKTYDLGNQRVTVCLQKDLSFLFVAESGKISKSLPKKGADADKIAAAAEDFDEMKKAVKKIVQNRQNMLFTAFLRGYSFAPDAWQDTYLKNPVLRSVAQLLVWQQGGCTFTLNATGPITVSKASYGIDPQLWITLAHPMEMSGREISAWQDYFVSQNLKQPFEQIWEPVVDGSQVTEDRYCDCSIPFYRFKNREKHGIFVEDQNYHNEITITFADCEAFVVRIDWDRHFLDMNHRFAVQQFRFSHYNRQVNHIVTYLDKCTVYDRILKDDISVAQFLPHFTLAQLTEFIKLASENRCHNVTAILLEYQQRNFPNFNPLAEFTLD